MRIALAADLHFGSVPEGLAVELADAIKDQHPTVTVIAGDLTLRARSEEFEQAQTWLQSLAPPALVIPGNHDLPFWNIIQRFSAPFQLYQKAANAVTLMPVIEQPGGLVLGFNTTGSWQPHLRWQEGVARRNDIEAAKQALSAAPPDQFKAVAAHHPFVKVPEVPRARPVRRAPEALDVFAAAGVDLIMSGHTHQSFAIETKVGGQSILSVGAPTALSTRMRGEANGFWIIEANKDAIVCTLWLRNGTNFSPASEKVFPRIRG
jgi:3',5'-cyclic AMP phosphodiesterase CpdA